MQPNHGTIAMANGEECQPTKCGSAGATIPALEEPEEIPESRHPGSRQGNQAHEVGPGSLTQKSR